MNRGSHTDVGVEVDGGPFYAIDSRREPAGDFLADAGHDRRLRAPRQVSSFAAAVHAHWARWPSNRSLRPDGRAIHCPIASGQG